MTIKELIEKLSLIENKELPVTIYDHEYSSWYDLETVNVITVPYSEDNDRNGQVVIELDN